MRTEGLEDRLLSRLRKLLQQLPSQHRRRVIETALSEDLRRALEAWMIKKRTVCDPPPMCLRQHVEGVQTACSFVVASSAVRNPHDPLWVQTGDSALDSCSESEGGGELLQLEDIEAPVFGQAEGAGDPPSRGRSQVRGIIMSSGYFRPQFNAQVSINFFAIRSRIQHELATASS